MQSILHNWHDNGGNNWPAMSLINCTLCRVSRFSAIFAFPLVFRYPPPDRSLARGRVVVSRARTASRNLIYRYAGRFIKASAQADICIPHAVQAVSTSSPSKMRPSKATIARIPRAGNPRVESTLETRANPNYLSRGIKYRSAHVTSRVGHYYSRYATYSNHVGTLGCALTRVADSIARTVEITRTLAVLVPAGRLLRHRAHLLLLSRDLAADLA